MLAQILPGFRDFRTPLVTGYLWLTALWIIIGMPVPSKDEKTGPIGIVNALGQYLSPVAVPVALSFLAYVVGILLAIDSKFATKTIARFGFKLQRVGTETGGTKWQKIRYADTRVHPSATVEEASTLTKVLFEAMGRVETRDVHWGVVYDEYHIKPPESEDYYDQLQELVGDKVELERRLRKQGLRQLTPLLSRELGSEIPVLATKLQEKNKDLFDSYDRDRSEAEFRLSIALPVLVLSVLGAILTFGGSWIVGLVFLVAGLVVFIALLLKGWRKILDSTGVVVTALEIGTIDSTVIERLDSLSAPQA